MNLVLRNINWSDNLSKIYYTAVRWSYLYINYIWSLFVISTRLSPQIIRSSSRCSFSSQFRPSHICWRIGRTRRLSSSHFSGAHNSQFGTFASTASHARPLLRPAKNNMPSTRGNKEKVCFIMLNIMFMMVFGANVILSIIMLLLMSNIMRRILFCYPVYYMGLDLVDGWGTLRLFWFQSLLNRIY